MRTVHVAGRLEVCFAGSPDAPRHALRLYADDDAFDIEVRSLGDLFAFRHALPALRAVRHGVEMSPRALNVRVGDVIVATWRPDRPSGWLDRWLGVNPLALRWPGLLRAVFTRPA
jgi:hypothetical protein